jgi:Na+-driven multidrug efflux pump
MVMTGAINQLPPENVHAFTVVSNVDGITSTIMNSYAQAAGTFAAQNFGARKYKRLVRSYLYGLFWSVGSAIVFGQLSLVFSKPLVGLFMDSTNPLRDQIFAAAIPMMQVMLNTLFLCGIMNVGTGVLRSIGYSMTSMIGCIICVVGGRLAWLYIFFPMEKFHTGAGAMVSFPAAWLLASVVITSTLFFCLGRVKRKFNSKVISPSNN